LSSGPAAIADAIKDMGALAKLEISSTMASELNRKEISSASARPAASNSISKQRTAQGRIDISGNSRHQRQLITNISGNIDSQHQRQHPIDNIDSRHQRISGKNCRYPEKRQYKQNQTEPTSVTTTDISGNSRQPTSAAIADISGNSRHQRQQPTSAAVARAV
jgi:hypothetical protein